MRLYVTPAGRWAGTQADARDLAKEDGGWEQREVETGKEGLLSFLNAHRVNAMHGEARAMIAVPPPPPAPASTARFSAANVIDRMDAFQAIPDPMKLTALEEAIQNADGAMLSSLLSNVISRLEELRREAKLSPA